MTGTSPLTILLFPTQIFDPVSFPSLHLEACASVSGVVKSPTEFVNIVCKRNKNSQAKFRQLCCVKENAVTGKIDF